MNSTLARATVLAALSGTAAYLLWRVYKDVLSPTQSSTESPSENSTRNTPSNSSAKSMVKLPVKILYATTTGTAKRLVNILKRELFALNISGFHFDLDIEDLAEYNPLNFEDETLAIILMPTWTGGTPVETGKVFYDYIQDMVQDFRVERSAFSKLRYAVFGLGNADYDDNWCKAAAVLDNSIASLAGERIAPLGKGNDSEDQEKQFTQWLQSLIPSLCVLQSRLAAPSEPCTAHSANQSSCGTCGSCGSGDIENAGSTSCSGKTSKGEKEKKTFLPRNEYRRQKRAMRERAQMLALAETLRKEAPPAPADDPKNVSPKAEEVVRSCIVESCTVANCTEPTHTLEYFYNEEDAANDALLLESDQMLLAMERGEWEEDTSETGVVVDAVESDEEIFLDEDANVVKKKKGTTKKFVPVSAAVASSTKVLDSNTDGSGVQDLEDMGSIIQQASEERKAEELASAKGAPPRDMVTPAQRRALVKEGYKIIGTHSAVKLCRWTKAMLRGRGGCYKWTCYGIRSYGCMEMTPSLACANKCTFCWRHHKNPVGREWRWSVDPPEMIVEEAVEKHIAMINEFKGAAGVLPERWAEAHTIRHCALSLVGEPIMYPHINQLMRLLHLRGISTFLVTNAQVSYLCNTLFFILLTTSSLIFPMQFPDAIANLEPVTQLYVSVDAATKDSLRAIDRPLFSDFWERFIGSLEAIRDKGQRTVYRLTLVKGQNMEDEHVQAYQELIRRGQPDFIGMYIVFLSSM